jgi:hypothetical protein
LLLTICNELALVMLRGAKAAAAARMARTVTKRNMMMILVNYCEVLSDRRVLEQNSKYVSIT